MDISANPLFEATPHPYLLLNPNLKIVAVNDSYLHATMTVRNQIVGRHLFEVFPDNPEDMDATGVTNLRASLIKVILTKKPHRMDIQKYDIPIELNSRFEVRYWSPLNTPVLNEKKQLLYIIHHVEDVTEQVLARKMAEKNIHEQNMEVENLKEERELRERFVSSLTHDLHTPLTAARLNMELIKRYIDDKDKILRILPKVNASLDRIDLMIRDLLDANRLKAGKGISLDIEKCDLIPVIHETLQVLRTVHGDRFVFKGPTSLMGNWSCEGFQRIVENLCSNAIKYGDPDTPISIELSSDKDEIILRIHNEGHPISEEDQKTLFDQFKRTSQAEKGKQKGWGIGLSLVKGIVEAHGGSITITSADGKGTTFTLLLPLDLSIYE